MYTRILVPLDGSRIAEQALPHAVALSQRFELGLELVRATEFAAQAEYYRYTPAINYPPYEEYVEQATAEARDCLQGLVEGIEHQGGTAR